MEPHLNPTHVFAAEGADKRGWWFNGCYISLQGQPSDLPLFQESCSVRDG